MKEHPPLQLCYFNCLTDAHFINLEEMRQWTRKVLVIMSMLNDFCDNLSSDISIRSNVDMSTILTHGGLQQLD